MDTEENVFQSYPPGTSDCCNEQNSGMQEPPTTNTLSLLQKSSVPPYTEFREWLREFVKGSNIVTDEMYEQIRDFLRSDSQKGKKGQSGDAKFRHAVRKKKYFLVNNPQLGLQDVIYTLNDKGQPRKLVSLEEIVNVLYEIHVLHTNHGGIRKTHRALSDYYAGIPEKVVRQFLLMCSHCTLQQKEEKTNLSFSAELQMRRGPRPRSHPRQIHVKPTPMPTLQVWANVQIRFVSMEHHPHGGCSWIMHLKDAVSQYTLLHSFSSLDAHAIAKSLLLYFTILTPPSFITPYQDEHVSLLNSVLKHLTSMWPRCKVRLGLKPTTQVREVKNPSPSKSLSIPSKGESEEESKEGDCLSDSQPYESTQRDYFPPSLSRYPHSCNQHSTSFEEDWEEEQGGDWEDKEEEDGEGKKRGEKENAARGFCSNRKKESEHSREVLEKSNSLFPLNNNNDDGDGDDIHAFLKKFCTENRRWDWTNLLPLAQWELNLRSHSFAKESPYSLMFSKKMKANENINLQCEENNNNNSYNNNSYSNKCKEQADKKRKNSDKESFVTIVTDADKNLNSKIVEQQPSDADACKLLHAESNHCRKVQKTSHPAQQISLPENQNLSNQSALLPAVMDQSNQANSISELLQIYMHADVAANVLGNPDPSLSELAKCDAIVHAQSPFGLLPLQKSHDFGTLPSPMSADVACNDVRLVHPSSDRPHVPNPFNIPTPCDDVLLPSGTYPLQHSMDESERNLQCDPPLSSPSHSPSNFKPVSVGIRNVSSSSSVTSDEKKEEMDNPFFMSQVKSMVDHVAAMDTSKKTLTYYASDRKETEDSYCMSERTEINPPYDITHGFHDETNYHPTSCLMSEGESDAFSLANVLPPPGNAWNPSSDFLKSNAMAFPSMAAFDLSPFQSFGNGEDISFAAPEFLAKDGGLLLPNSSRNGVVGNRINEICYHANLSTEFLGKNNPSFFENDCFMCTHDHSLPCYLETTNGNEHLHSLPNDFHGFAPEPTAVSPHPAKDTETQASQLRQYNTASGFKLGFSDLGLGLVSFMEFASLSQFTNLLLDAWVDLSELEKMNEQDLMAIGMPAGACKKLKRSLARWANESSGN